MRIYTRTGDDGTTGLFGGARLRKDDVRVSAYGRVDELNAALGWARAAPLPARLDVLLADAQERCLRMGAFLACAPSKDPGIEGLAQADVERLERAIDELEADLEPLKSFVLPGGCEAAARLHVARTVCRRAERGLVTLGAGADPLFVRWINRLSDLLFVQARWANHDAGCPDVLWQPRKR